MQKTLVILRVFALAEIQCTVILLMHRPASWRAFITFTQCHQCIPAVVSHKSGWLERMLPPGTIMHMPLPTQHFGVWNIVSSWDRERQCYFLCVNMSRLGSPLSFPSLPRVCLTLNYIMYLCQWQMTVKVLSSQQIQQSGGPQYARGKEWRNPQGRSRAKLQLPSFIFHAPLSNSLKTKRVCFAAFMDQSPTTADFRTEMFVLLYLTGLILSHVVSGSVYTAASLSEGRKEALSLTLCVSHYWV